MLRSIGRAVAVLVLLNLTVVGAGIPREQPDVRLFDLEGRLVSLFGSAKPAQASVLVFVSSDCPISNRYAPQLTRLFDRFASQGVRFWLVYANPADGPDVIRAHQSAYSLALPAVRDPGHEAARFAGVRVTPEAAVFDGQARLVYRGRIDDRFPVVGVERPVASRHDLQDAIATVLTGGRPVLRTTDAVGCYLSDMTR